MQLQRKQQQKRGCQEKKGLGKMSLVDQASQSKMMNNSLITGVTSVLLVGNPGVGKSTILNALGGSFPSGYSEVSGMTKQISTQPMKLQGRRLRLIDMPGIYDATEGKDDAIDRHLSLLHDTLNDGSDYVIFFVITPRNGRIDPGDLTLMKLLLGSMKEGPLVGLILTQVKKRDYDAVRSRKYFSQLRDVLTKGEANLRFLREHDALTLRDHDDRFSEQELLDIQTYVLACQPKLVVVHNLVVGIWRSILDAFKRLFSRG
ncbi:hypothetical protein BGZ51_001887 [Haplosporangium sp. Z 767]|nr:hypothetical protein BGZ51_001887 [Haplosporangium sp. Z 767]KAF9195743.1 hypothetical protein BGZ50_003690 [Haplosporangium sp. Z 11]